MPPQKPPRNGCPEAAGTGRRRAARRSRRRGGKAAAAVAGSPRWRWPQRGGRRPGARAWRARRGRAASRSAGSAQAVGVGPAAAGRGSRGAARWREEGRRSGWAPRPPPGAIRTGHAPAHAARQAGTARNARAARTAEDPKGTRSGVGAGRTRDAAPEPGTARTARRAGPPPPAGRRRGGPAATVSPPPAGRRCGGGAAARSRQAGLAACVRYSPGVLPNHLRNARWKPTALW